MTASSSPTPKPSPRPGKPAGSSDGTKPAADQPATPKHATKTDAPPATSTAAVAAGRVNGGSPATGAKHAADPTIGQLVSDATTHLSTLIHSEIELAKLELRTTVRVGIVSAAAFIAAAILALFSLIYGFQAIAEAIATTLPRWAAFLIVFGGFFVLALLLVWFGAKKIKRVKAPERTIKTTRETVDYLKKSRG